MDQVDQIFTSKGRRHFRRTYSAAEFRVSLVVLAALIGIGSWVAWRGRNPDAQRLLVDQSVIPQESRALPERASPQSATSTTAKPHPVGPQWAKSGWRLLKTKRYSAENMYEKINGRDSFYRSFGCKGLVFATLTDEKNSTNTVDLEMFEMGELKNALGVYAGERQPEAKVELRNGTMGHRAQNALFLVRGGYYLRAIGSSENKEVLAQLAHVWTETGKTIPAESLPWAYELFSTQLKLPASQVAYFRESAFSFGFAKDVYIGKRSDGGQSFASAATSAEAARALATQYATAFSNAGEKLKPSAGVQWIKENYINTVSGAKAVSSLVIGVYRMPDQKTAQAALAALEQAARALPQQLFQPQEKKSVTPAPAKGDNEDVGAPGREY